VFVCNNTSFVDWLYLNYRYSPCFTRIVIVDGNKVGLRILGPIETIMSAIGLRFPEEVKGDQAGNVYYSIKELKEKDGFLWYRGRRPVVVFPEGTKTNGCGILNLENGVVKLIDKACSPDENLRLHAIRFDHVYKWFSPYNSFDSLGISMMF